MKRKTESIIEIRMLLEYSAFFVGEKPIDIPATLKLYSRNSLIRAAATLSLHFGNTYISDENNTLFSASSKKYQPYLNELFKAYYKREGLKHGQKVEVVTFRTSLELWRQVFAIRVEEFTNEVSDEDFEILLFKVLLAINEKLVSFKKKKEQYNLDELLFLNGFITNDSNNYDFKAIIQPQIYYFRQLIEYIPSNDVLAQAAKTLLHDWGIDNWQQYYTTIFLLAYQTDKYYKNKEDGVPIISQQWMEENQKNGLIAPSLIAHLFIDEDDYKPYQDANVPQKELNVDFRAFRSKPFVKLKDGTGYVIINNQLLCERLFNSLYFDFLPLINGGKKSVGLLDYNKDFIEKVLFRNTFFKCIPSNCFTFPRQGNNDTQEERHAPDFYARTKRNELIIVECKAIKMNGESRDDGDFVRLLDELHEKTVLKTRNLDPSRGVHKGEPEPIGVGQLIHHINSIDADTFLWDTKIPLDVSYYPILVFEDVKLLQKGILSMVNRWFYEEIARDKNLGFELSEAYMPIMVVSINTLYLYDDILRKRGLPNVIDSFVSKNAIYDENNKRYVFSAEADFDEYLREKRYDKRNDVAKWFRKMMNESRTVQLI